MDNKFLHDLLEVMIKRHGAINVSMQLNELHAKMSVSDSAAARLIQKQKKEKECDRCGGGPGYPHYCK